MFPTTASGRGTIVRKRIRAIRNRLSSEAKYCVPAVRVDFEELKFGNPAFPAINVSRSNAIRCDKQKRHPVRIGSELQYIDPTDLHAKCQALDIKRIPSKLY